MPYLHIMKNIYIIVALFMLTACNNSVKSIEKQAQELCKHIPDLENLEESKGYLTEDFYGLLDQMVSLPDFAPVLHEWEFWFVSADGTLISTDECKVLKVEKTDATHATALIEVQPAESDYDTEEHTLYLEKVKGRWLLDNYDGTKQASRRRIRLYGRDSE